MFTIEFSLTAEKQLAKLEKTVQTRIISTLERMQVRPHHFVKRLVGLPYYRLRVGEYRVIIDIQETRLIIFVIEVGHRKAIYK